MKLIIIRHCDPDYSIDSLTKKGWGEAEFLSERVAAMDVKEFYTSPLGRARDTASVSLKRIGREAEVLPWLREFHAPIIDKSTGRQRITWDWRPSDWTSVDEYYDKNLWHTTPIMQDSHVIDEAMRVCDGLDGILKIHGYERNGRLYKAVNPNNDTIVMFCHFGVECIMLWHLLGISPMVLWHNLCAAPSSVTTLITEERQRGTAAFRMNSFGDTSHLYAAKEEPAFAARFCETYDNMDERHD